MDRSRSVVTVMVLLALLIGGLGLAAGVPDARLIVDDATVTPESPDPGETTTVDLTVSNSTGSDEPVTIDEVTLRDGEQTYATAENVSALSPGDSVSVPLSTAFEDAGVHELTATVEGTYTDLDDEGEEIDESVTITYPVTVVVGGVDTSGVENDVQVDAQAVDASSIEDEQDDETPGVDLNVGDLGGGLGGATIEQPDEETDEDDSESSNTVGDRLLRIEVTNFGTATARSVVAEPTTADSDLPRLPVDDLAPGEQDVVFLDLARIDSPGTVDLTARYTLGTTRYGSETAYEYAPDPTPAATLDLTDLDLVADDDRVSISGNVANVGTADANGAVVSIGEAAGVDPVYPQRSYFVGTVPESDFVGFDLTATVEDDVDTVPVTVTYLDDGVERDRTVDLDYAPRGQDNGEESRALWPFALGGGIGLLTLGGSALVWRRRNGDE